MARQNSTITVVGKLGNMVGTKGLDGKTNAMAYVPGEDRADAKTAEQVYQRSRLALASKVAGMLGVLGDQSLVANGIAPNRRGMLVRTIMAHINDAVGGPELGSSLPLVRNPKAEVNIGDRVFNIVVPTAQSSGSVSYSFAGTVERGTLIRYCVALLVFNKSKGEWRSTAQVLTEAGRVRVYIPGTWKDDQTVCYGYVLAATTDPTVIGETATMGSLTGTTENYSIAVDSSSVLYGNNVAYSQVDVATSNETISAN